MTGVRLLAPAIVLAAWIVPPADAAGQAAPTPPAVSSCMACHSNPDMADEASQAIVEAFREKHDVHAAVGLSCQDCHGGNPDPALGDDMDAAMDEHYAPAPFVGAPGRRDIPDFCGRCHSDPVFMKRYKPDARVDQEREYWTSQHGKALRTGDEKVAVCVDCHGSHGILAPSNPDSTVYPTHVAETCRKCHADPEHMQGYTLADGEPLPVDQYARWRQSVHAAALLEHDDLSAPTCNDCHGNHGAAPPGVESVAFVCGQCHGREAELFRASPKQAGFAAHNDLLEGVGEEGCATCHSDPDPAAHLEGVHGFSDCVTCHGNHGIVRPTLAMLSPLPAIPCVFCHEPPASGLEAVPEPPKKRRHYEELRDELLAAAKARHLEGDALFDFMVDAALALPTHTEAGTDEEGRPKLRPEFARLFQKFRIGKTHYTYRDPKTGQDVEAKIVRCSDCHAAEPTLTDEAKGLETSSFFLSSMEDVVGHTARAERLQLTARRGGVETRPVLLEIDQAVDSQIQLEVLVHTFSAGGAFADKKKEGLEHATAALQAGQQALAELTFRREGLIVALVFVLLVLVGLAFKIRQLSRTDSRSDGSGSDGPAP